MIEIDRKKLLAIMAEKGITQTDIAKRAGFQRQVVSFILTGKQKRIRPSTAGKFANALGVDVWDFGSITEERG